MKEGENPRQEDQLVQTEDLQAAEKPPFTEPKLTYVKPQLVEHGEIGEVTAGFLGTFYP